MAMPSSEEIMVKETKQLLVLVIFLNKWLNNYISCQTDINCKSVTFTVKTENNSSWSLFKTHSFRFTEVHCFVYFSILLDGRVVGARPFFFFLMMANGF